MLKTVSHGYFYIFDLDNFKQVNDIFGHVRGDEILIHFSNILTKVFVNDAIIGRLGGDEFAVLNIVINQKRMLKIRQRRF